LVYSTDGSSVGQSESSCYAIWIGSFSEFPHTINAIRHWAVNDTIIFTGTIDPGIFEGQLVGINVLLIPEQESGSPGVWSNLAPVIQNYLNNGGSVIFCGSASSESDCMFNTGVFSGSFNSNVNGFL